MAVSAVTPRAPLTMALMRLEGTCSSAASALALSLSGFKNSSRKISPGWVVVRVGVIKAVLHAMGSVVVRDLDRRRSFFRPDEANPELVVDPDAVLALAVSFKRFEPVAGRGA